MLVRRSSLNTFETHTNLDNLLDQTDDIGGKKGKYGRVRRRVIIINTPLLDGSDNPHSEPSSEGNSGTGGGSSGIGDKPNDKGDPIPDSGDDKGGGSPDKTKDLIIDTNDINQLQSAVRQVRDDLGKMANVLDWKFGSGDLYHDLQDWYHYWYQVSKGLQGGNDLTSEIDQTIKVLIQAVKWIRTMWDVYLEALGKLQTIVLPDGSVFAIHKSTSVENVEQYWKVLYDTRPEVNRCNIFTMIRKHIIVYYDYIYITGPTISLPSDTIHKTEDYCIKYESIRMEDLLYFWKEGDVYYGDKPLGSKPLGGIDPLAETEQKMKQWIGTIEDSTITVKPTDSGGNDNGGNSSEQDTTITLPADFFTHTHTLGELINLHLVDPTHDWGNEYTTVSGPEAEYLIEMFPFIKYKE